MNSSSVYWTLKELFPQVDARLLKAAAIEHPDDPDASVEFIVTEVLPYATKQLGASSFIVENERDSVTRPAISSCASSSTHESTSHAVEAAKGSGSTNVTKSYCGFSIENGRDSVVPSLAFSACASSSKHESTYPAVEAAKGSEEINMAVHGSLNSTYSDAKDIGDHLIGNTGEAASGSLEMDRPYQEAPICLNETVEGGSLHATSGGKEDIGNQLSISTGEGVTGAGSMNEICNGDTPYLNERVAVLVDGQKETSNFIHDIVHGSNYVELSSLAVKDHGLDPLDCSIESEVPNSVFSSDHQIPECNGMADGSIRGDSNVPDSAMVEESTSMHTVLTKSDQLCNTDLLEDIVENARYHKRILLYATESVLKLMREVELEEKMAQQAKEEAWNGGLDILAKVDELKNMLNRAREANDMHSGEVYGERAILATEMKELQSRLLVLSDEKDDSLTILDTMQQALQTRLAAAEAERIAAEKEKCDKEESAQKTLAEQELIMEKVMQESKKLQHEAEENAKLREFLVDRGHVVDILQGEISVICQDVKFLKEKYDSNVPLNKCLSSEQTSCILASSHSSFSSSMRSTESEKVLEQRNWSSSSDDLFLVPSAEQVSESDQKELVEEGWELFDAEP